MSANKYLLFFCLVALFFSACKSSSLLKEDSRQKVFILQVRVDPHMMSDINKACACLPPVNIEAVNFSAISREELEFPLFECKPVELFRVGTIKLTFIGDNPVLLSEAIDKLRSLPQVMFVKEAPSAPFPK